MRLNVEWRKRIRATLAGLAAIAAIPSVLHAQAPAELVRDIGNVVPLAYVGQAAGGSNPSEFVRIGGRTFFTAFSEASTQVWRTDGTSAGTVALGPPGTSHPLHLISSDNMLYFRACDTAHGCEVWKSDGTVAGTSVLDINPGPAHTGLSAIVDVRGDVYLTSSSGVLIGIGFEDELWRTDGTVPGSVRVQQIPGKNLQNLTPVADGLFFVACGLDPFTFVELCDLWVARDYVTQIRPLGVKPSGSTSNPFALTAVNDELFFVWDDLWKCTSIGTCSIVKDRPNGDPPRGLTRVGAYLYFVVETCGALWRTDGTEAGTTVVRGCDDFYGAQPLGELDGKLILNGCDYSGNCGLWSSDGTPAGTTFLASVFGSATFPTAQAIVVNHEYFFGAVDPTHGAELWKTDGTAAGTMMVKDIVPGSASSNPSAMGELDGTLLFNACTDEDGCELWKSDGTPSGTVLVKDLWPQTAGSEPQVLAEAGGQLFFSATDSAFNYELWKSDGSIAGTTMVKDIVPGSGGSWPTHLTNVNGSLFFRACALFSEAGGESSDCELWTSDGTAAGTTLVKDILPGTSSTFSPLPLFADSDHLLGIDGTLFFTFHAKRCSLTFNQCTVATQAVDCPGGQTCDDKQWLWRSDGTSAGTYEVNPGSGVLRHENLTDVDGILYFSGWDIWRSDGTSAGTVKVSNEIGDRLIDVNGTLFFLSCTDVYGCELWKSDGTGVGTVLVKDIRPGNSSGINSTDVEWASAGGTLFFVANDGASGYELWKSDGSAAGTVMVKDIQAGSNSPSIGRLTAVGSRAFFSAFDGPLGQDEGLWITDGTAAGTVKLAAVYPQNLTDVGGHLFFTAYTDDLGLELWKSDGTPAGTVVATDVWPGTNSSEPRLLTVVGSDLYFRARGASVGSEVWRLRNAATCGNGIVDGSEGCDDANFVDDDGCDSNCTNTDCGNGIVTGGESCDDGNTNEDDACTNSCTPNICGDGSRFPTLEECDDGNAVNGDTCDSDCTIPGCGNGIVTTGEECDTGLANGSGTCSIGCAVCGNGVVGAGEQCDDGNSVETDGCANTCILCGDGIVSGAEDCDDGNLIAGDGCEANCQFDPPSTATPTSTSTLPSTPTQTPTRTLTSLPTHTATRTLTPSNCGNGTVNAGETCDDGNLVDGDGCDSNCRPTGCGNSIVTAPEQCDDGNLNNGDGCESDCTASPCGLHTATDLPKSLTDFGTAISTVNVAGSDPVTLVRVVGLQGSHTYMGDLRFRLRAPNGSEVVIMDQVCGGNDNFFLTLRDDAGAGILCPPTDGAAHRPSNALTALVGAPSGGNWQLLVEDLAGGDVGSLAGWGLYLCTGTSYCGNGLTEAGEQCDDGNAVDGDGCECDCTTTPTDSVVLPIAPISIAIAAGETSATKTLRVAVVNGDLLPAPALPGHTIQLSATTTCLGATLSAPDFDGTTPGEQDSILVAGGQLKKAKLSLTVPSSVTSLNKKSPSRCTVTFTASDTAGVGDSSPSNNTFTVDVNVIDKNDPDQATATESVIGSLKALKVIVLDLQPSVSKNATVKVVNADIVPAAAIPGHSITVIASDGTCPVGTVAVVDYDTTTSGSQNSVTVKGGSRKAGKLAVTVNAAAFTSENAKSPHRCTATLTASDGTADADVSNDTTNLTIDVYDKNDF